MKRKKVEKLEGGERLAKPILLDVGTVLIYEDTILKKEYIDKLDILLSFTDLVMLDIKHIESESHKALTGHKNENILAFAKYLEDEQTPVESQEKKESCDCGDKCCDNCNCNDKKLNISLDEEFAKTPREVLENLKSYRVTGEY